MSEAIAAALITGVFAVITQLIIAKRSAKDLYSELEKQDVRLEGSMEKYQGVTDVKIEELTREVRLHNGFAERIPRLEERVDSAIRRIDNIEKK